MIVQRAALLASLISLLISASVCFAQPRPEVSEQDAEPESGRKADTGSVLTGTVTVKGSEPRTFVALTTGDGKVYRITGPLAGDLGSSYQYRKATLRGKITQTAAGPGMEAVFQAEEIVSPADNGEKPVMPPSKRGAAR